MDIQLQELKSYEVSEGYIDLLEAQYLQEIIFKSENEDDDEENDEYIRRCNVKRDRDYVHRFLSNLSPREFKLMFRMSREKFFILLKKVEPLLTTSARGAVNAKNSSGSPILPITKLGAALRYLAGGSYIDISATFGLSMLSFFCYDRGPLWKTLHAIDEVEEINFPLNNIARLQRIREDFAKLSYNRIDGCLMAVDGLVVQTRMPTAHEVENTSAFVNRKGFFGVVVIAGCDAHGRFMMWCCKHPGSTNDILAWEMSEFYQNVCKADLLPPGTFVIADEGLVCTRNCLVPYSGNNIGIKRDSFNFHLSRMRQVIERAFGILVHRWGILWRPLTCALERWPLILRVCAKLHNFLIEDRMEGTDSLHHEDEQPNDQCNVHVTPDGVNAVDDDALRNYRKVMMEDSKIIAYGGVRDDITEHLAREGYTRPTYADANNRS